VADIKLTPVVACALVDADGRVLIAQRPPGKSLAGLWEFPGRIARKCTSRSGWRQGRSQLR
jgi:8-oxo-dGTP pyrophosphatase MutT (NUDIX family)